ncbi:regulatory protein [Novosphingobium nitrogenifigens DSM 19370]|uniref:Regulatory protein n=1 Tax=Novosphingobium nitrogenifigens DSM 19370 TaxID=983920 RepID=F1ZCU0_9SPHN|nr:GlxA family transcriptional regulator [Novosphingobium nitrogenifigens]EGD57577.1 regulatory protein [Novosphingobium nitrogenifigens DSM 19370]
MPESVTPSLSFPPPIRMGLWLTPGFALMSYAALIEPFRAANALSDRPVYEWVHISADGAAVEASNGARISTDARVGDRIDCSMLFVFAGGDPRAFRDSASFAWLRLLARQGVAIAGVSAGPFLMARAGLLQGRRATIHWEHAPAMRAEFPDLTLETGLYVVDGPMITCAGGTAGLDLALALIARDQGRGLAARVGEWFIRTAPRDAAGPQRGDLAERHGTSQRAVLRALELIEARLDQPWSRQDLADRVGLSLRHLERLFEAELGQSMTEAAMGIRLDEAAHRLRTTDGSITEIALDCGFASAAHFSRRYRERFGVPPSQARPR